VQENPPFHSGQRVVCINARNVDNPHQFSSKLIEGEKYNIRDCFTVEQKISDNIWAVHLEEIMGVYMPEYDVEKGFMAKRFRPLDDIDDKISNILETVIKGEYDKSLDDEENPYKVKKLEEVK
jgi:hypothetical protein